MKRDVDCQTNVKTRQRIWNIEEQQTVKCYSNFFNKEIQMKQIQKYCPTSNRKKKITVKHKNNLMPDMISMKEKLLQDIKKHKKKQQQGLKQKD